MNKTNYFNYYIFSACFFLMAACTNEEIVKSSTFNPALQPISLSGEIDQLTITRVNDNGFCDKDVMGVYIVDYEANVPGKLKDKGNRGDNVYFTFDEAAYKWNSAYDVYWKDSKTHIDIYGYYPTGKPASVSAYEFNIQKNQNKTGENGSLGGYEASDFLWGKAADIAPTEKVIRLPLRHRMSNARITLMEGKGFTEGTWPKLEKHVLVSNTKCSSVIDLASGNVSAIGEVSEAGIIPFRRGDEFRAIVIPQAIASGTVLFSITIDGISYTFKKDEEFIYQSGKMHNFTIKVNKKEQTGQFEFELIGESITAWENDLASHESITKEYIVIDSKAGKLKDALIKANKNYKLVKNLKIVGEINGVDFYFMRDSMGMLQALNLKEVKIARTDTMLHYGSSSCQPRTYSEDEIPDGAMAHKTTLLHLTLPDRLKTINYGSFENCKNLTGSLIIPEGVTEIRAGAFYNCSSLTGSLILPTTLKYLGRGWETYWMGGTFQNCSFSCELILPSELEYIGEQTFFECPNLYGELRLPDKLKNIKESAFAGCRNLTGSLSIPQHIIQLPDGVFRDCGFNGTLTLHNGILSIGKYAFNNTQHYCPVKMDK